MSSGGTLPSAPGRWGVVLRCVFFLSGAAALLFETLWFRQAGLMLGNTVWASAIVTASFMAGLALGSALAARVGSRIASPLLAYAALELVVAFTGVTLVLAFPFLTLALAPLLRSVLAYPGLLNGVRLLAAALLLLIPSTAMGATLPLLVRLLSKWHGSYGWALGQLYGWNTCGAMAGALAGEMALVEAFGVRGTAWVAAALNLLAAGAAVLASRRLEATRPTLPAAVDDVGGSRTAGQRRLSSRSRYLLAAAFVAGAVLLALETVWFRFLLLFVPTTTAAFAVMLSVVLLGIGAGGLAASAWLKHADADRYTVLVSLLAGFSVVMAYVAFRGTVPTRGSNVVIASADMFAVSLRLMLPTCLISGLLFTLLGRSLQAEEEDEARTTGLLTLSNTLGATTGALFTGFLLLPRLGMEASLFALASAYGLVALFLLPTRRMARGRLLAEGTAGALFLLLLALFPFGLMNRRFLKVVADRWSGDGSHVVAVREGLTETIVLLRKDLWGQPLYHRLVTNGTGMSGTTTAARRYTAAFVWLPVAVHPAPRRALLISYGCGTTARALTDTAGLETIDVVDISRDIMDMSPVLHPPPDRDPLADPRVRVHVEDGRFHLLVSPDRYDIITAEPPPLKNAGIVNLYSREYFGLLRDRLAEGGIVTYWLPVAHLSLRETRSVIGAFCGAFSDCSLWTSWGAEWMLVGTRGAVGGVSREAFSRQWQDPVVGRTLRDAGLETPEQLGAMFLADAGTLRSIAAPAPPLVDDRPYRLSPRFPLTPRDPVYLEIMEASRARERFANSDLIRRLWPPDLRESSLAWFATQEHLNRYFWATDRFGPPNGMQDLEPVVTGTSLRTAVLWLMGSSPEQQRIADRAAREGVQDPFLDVTLGIRHMADRDYGRAERAFAQAEERVAYGYRLRSWRILALAAAGDKAGAAALLAASRPWMRKPGARDGSWEWLATRFGLARPEAAPENP